MAQINNKERYVQWVQENYDPNILVATKVNRFLSPPPEQGCSLGLEERAYLYVFRKFPLMLEGSTGSGKTTLVENLAVRLNLPFYRAEGRERLSLMDTLVDPQMQDGKTLMYPRELTLAAIHEGIFFLEEAANIDPNKMVEFHSVLQNKQISVPTQFGSIQFDLSDIENFRIVAAGNFAYQKPNFSIASLQRYVWMVMPYMGTREFTASLRADSEGKAQLSEFTDDLRKLETRFDELYGTKVTATPRAMETLAALLTSIRDKTDKENLGFHQNQACYKRAQVCYSPGLTPDDFYQFVLETAVIPIAAKNMYLGKQKPVDKFKEIARNEIDRHKNIFEGKVTEAARGMRLPRLGRLLARERSA